MKCQYSWDDEEGCYVDCEDEAQTSVYCDEHIEFHHSALGSELLAVLDAPRKRINEMQEELKTVTLLKDAAILERDALAWWWRGHRGTTDTRTIGDIVLIYAGRVSDAG